MGIFDSHAHYDTDQFEADRDMLLGEVLPKSGVTGIVNMAVDLERCETTLALTRRYGYIYGAAGIHPEDAKELPADWLDRVREYLIEPKMVAIGEIGLDYHYLDACPKERQKEVFEAQLGLAKDLNLPVSVHDREAHGDTLELLRRYRPKGVLHCFSGSLEMAREVISFGMYLGFGGAATFKKARLAPEVIAEMPLERLLLETDAPYMAPEPYRGKRCDSSMILRVAQKVGEIKGLPTAKILEITEENARRLFGL